VSLTVPGSSATTVGRRIHPPIPVSTSIPRGPLAIAAEGPTQRIFLNRT
jgi:hypothetical protein